MAPPVTGPTAVPPPGPDINNRVSYREEDSMNNEPSQSGKPIVGIIYPPPEIRNIVDKTASFVARNGVEFENRIRSNEATNPKFNFLNPIDPYHAYYQHKVREFQEGTTMEPSIPKPSVPQKVQEAVKAAEFIPRDPPPEFEFVADPATINAFDLDLIKMTGLFVARNGRQFLTGLMNREARNYQFDFLKPQHSNFSYFTKLVEQYTKVLIPPKDIGGRLRIEISNPKALLEHVGYRVEWERLQRRIRQREEAEAEKERLAYAQIDWHDFVVVQTVDFSPHENLNLPPPCTPKDVGARILAQARIAATKAAAQAVEMEVESDSEPEMEDDSSQQPQVELIQPQVLDVSEVRAAKETEKSVTVRSAHEVVQPTPAAPRMQDVVVRDYNPKAKPVEKVKSAAEKWVISPLTGEKVPADKLMEHMRYNTVDSQYYIQREREIQDRQEDDPVFAHGVDISSNIRAFAERRTDIFGVGEMGAEQTIIGKKMGEEERPRPDPKSIWDGHAASIDATTKAAASAITIEQQIAEIHKAQGLVPDREKERIGPAPTSEAPPQLRMAQPMRMAMVPVVPMAMTYVPPSPIMRGITAAAPPSLNIIPSAMGEDEEPAFKRPRAEDNFLPEAEFLARQPSSQVVLKVLAPVANDKPEWNLKGQTFEFAFSLKEQVANIKLKVQEATSMPASKQKLLYEGIFVKDTLSLAYYNMENGCMVQLQLKERGGRKR